MFGDIGHGMLLFLAGVYINLKGTQLLNMDRDPQHPLNGYRGAQLPRGEVYCRLRPKHLPQKAVNTSQDAPACS